MAQKQGGLLWELRASLGLARLLAAQGQTANARGLLAPVYARFTSGFATSDLRTARALLDTLPSG